MIRLFLRGMDPQYDPRFGAAFYHGAWNAGFNHAQALPAITVLTMLLHADHSWTDDGTLFGAMDRNDADRAMGFLRNGIYRRIDAEHVIHLDTPGRFSRLCTRSPADSTSSRERAGAEKIPRSGDRGRQTSRTSRRECHRPARNLLGLTPKCLLNAREKWETSRNPSSEAIAPTLRSVSVSSADERSNLLL